MSTLLLLTSTTQPSADVLPALALLPHQVKILPAEGSALLDAPEVRSLREQVEASSTDARSWPTPATSAG